MKKMMKMLVAFTTIIMLFVTCKADYMALTRTEVNLRNENGKKIAVIPEGERIEVKEDWSEKRVCIKWKNFDGNIRKNAIGEEVIPAMTDANVNQRDNEGNVIQTIPDGSEVFLKEAISDKERTLVEFEGKEGTVLTESLLKNYIIVDIENQAICMYKDNLLLCAGPIVSGTATNPKRATPKGTFEIYYKEPDTTLDGPGYSSHVNYWMPFNKGIGIHDADEWRSEYGGEIYKYSGSHGCINVPIEIAEKIYKNAKVGTKVVVM